MTAEECIAELNAIADAILRAHESKDWAETDRLRAREQAVRLRFDAIHWEELRRERAAAIAANEAICERHWNETEAIRVHRANAEQIYREGFAALVAAIAQRTGSAP